MRNARQPTSCAQRVARRKRRDRALQVATLAAAALAASSITSGALGGLRALSPDLSEPPLLPGLGAGLFVGALGFQVSRVWEAGMAPADVLAKTLQPVTDVISAENRGTSTADGDDDDAADDDDDRSGSPPPFVGKGGLPLL